MTDSTPPPNPPPTPQIVNKDPAVRYDVPQDVLDDERLSIAEKSKRLADWEFDLTRRSESNDEGMAITPIDRSEKLASLLEQVKAAQATLADQAGDAANSTQ